VITDYDSISLFKGSRADIKKHMSEKQVEHVAMVTGRISSIETNLRQTQSSIQEHQETAENRANNYREELASLRDDVATLRAAVDRSPNRSHEVEESARPLPAGEPQGAGKPDVDEAKDVKEHLQRLEDQVKQLLVRERQALGRGQVGEPRISKFDLIA
jgi:DNA repair exonuclease SbcCD ATPase subunit